MESNDSKVGGAVTNLSDVSETNILGLDDLSLEIILLKCDPTSYLNLKQTCKKFHTLSQKCLNEKTWEQHIGKGLVHFLCAIVESCDVTNKQNHYRRNIQRYEYDEDPHRIRADIAELILNSLLQSIRLINYIRDCNTATMEISPVVHEMIMYSLKAKDLHMKSIYSVFYILGVTACYVFEHEKGKSKVAVDDTVVLCKTMCGFSIFTYNPTKKNAQNPMVYYYMEEYRQWSTKGDPYRNSYDDVKGICQRLSTRIFNDKDVITPETLIELCKLKFPSIDEMNKDEYLHEGKKKTKALDEKTKMKVIRSIKERLFKNCVDFVAFLHRTELKKSDYAVKDYFKLFLQPLLAYCSFAKYSRQERLIGNLIDSVEPLAKLYNASSKWYFPTMAQILSLVDVANSNIGFYKEKTEKHLVFLLGSKEVMFRKEAQGYFVTMNGHTSKLHMGDKTDEEQKNIDELLATFNDHVNMHPSAGGVNKQPTKVTLHTLSVLCFHGLGI